MRAYAWTITKDHTADPDEPGTCMNAAGMVGPRKAPLTSREIQEHHDRIFFQMGDDDGELYYEGYLVEDKDCDGFEPLDDFGAPNAGCTWIKHRNKKTGVMEML